MSNMPSLKAREVVEILFRAGFEKIRTSGSHIRFEKRSNNMDEQIIYQKYLDSSLHFLSFRPRSEKEVRDNLVKKKAPQEIIERILLLLKEKKFVNDEEFTRWWIEQRSRFRPKGMRVVKLELKQKGITQDIIENILTGGAWQIESELEQAKKIVEKKILKYKGLDRREIYQKLGAHLARKGFDWETIKQAIDAYLKKE